MWQKQKKKKNKLQLTYVPAPKLLGSVNEPNKFKIKKKLFFQKKVARFAIANDAAHKLLLNYQLFLLNVITKTHFFPTTTKTKTKKRKRNALAQAITCCMLLWRHKKKKKTKKKRRLNNVFH